jgi:bacillithiol biosynthesis cysteine-adding enzyme BshC
MLTKTISYSKTGFFSKLICDYVDEEEALSSFYHRFPRMENFEIQLNEKGANFDKNSREILVRSLTHQYEGFHISEATEKNLKALSQTNTFTITTGHQLNLFTGPLYFLYKIFSVINLTETLNKTYNDYHFVPVYWMATEDHDFEEINYFNLNGKKIQWKHEAGGAVGSLNTRGLEEVLKSLEAELKTNTFSKTLCTWFKEAYLNHDTLAQATRYLANELFKEYGLVIIDGDDTGLKSAFVPYAIREFGEHPSFETISRTTERLTSLGYQEQVHAREINLFYLQDGLRERIIERNGSFFVNNSEISFSKTELMQALEKHPERFSPNALLRPLYQEVVLPNLCYVGGGGELAYWFQLKDYFASVDIPFPILLLRNSALLMPDKISEKLNKLNISTAELFMDLQDLKNLHTRSISEIKIDFGPQREHLKKQFESMYELAVRTDASFLGAVAAQEKKQLNGLDKLEKRLLKAQRRRFKDELERLSALHNDLFPGGNLQERSKNFSEFYVNYGPEWLLGIKEELDPLVNKFTVIRW